jgi:hypothetical protein
MTHQQKLTLETRLWRAGIIVAFSIMSFLFAKLYNKIEDSHDAWKAQTPINATFGEYHKMHFTWQDATELRLDKIQENYYMLNSKIKNP